MPGIYDEAGSQVTEIVNLPNPINFRIIAQGEKVDAVAMDVISHKRSLDTQKGLLVRRTIYSTASKERFDYQSLRFFSMKNPHIGAMQIHFTPLDGDADILVETFVDTSMTNKGILSEGRKRHFEVNKFISTKTMDYVGIRTFQKKISVGYANYLKIGHNGKKYATGEKVMRFYVKKGDTITFTKIFAIHSTRDLGFRGKLGKKTIASLRRNVKIGFDNLLKEHIAAWRKKWDIVEIDIKPDLNLQKAIRLNIYHMLIAANPLDNRVSIPARTFSGEGYRGHIFWDTDIFILPLFIYTSPKIAKNMLQYRYRMLPAARRNARASGYKGALFAWESADTGVDTTPEWHRDLDGKVIKIHTGQMEHHIVADVAYAVNHYYVVTGDEDFMLDAGLEIMFETARFWASRVKYNERKDLYSIRDVIGPDEFHVDINDNAFTNIMARWNLVRATQLYRRHEAWSRKRFQKLIKRIRLREGEIRNWARISNRIAIRTNRDGIIEAFSGFFERKYIPIRNLDDNFMPMLPKSVSLRKIKRTQFTKQADVLMLFNLFPESYPLSQRKKNFVYYDKRTLHMSSLSTSMYALAGWEAHYYDKAYHYFVFSLYNDLENKHGNTEDGIHAAASGGNWQVVFHGFAGIRIVKSALRINPHLPHDVNSLDLKLKYRKWLLTIHISKNSIRISPSSDSDSTLKIYIYDKMRELKNGVLSVFERKEGGKHA
jgi:kojibiose phosphorylase